MLLCYWHSSICCVLFSREALLQDNTSVTRSRRQAAQLLIVLIVTFFILILPHKIWATVQQCLNYKQLYKIGFRRHSLIIICTRSLLYLNSAVSSSTISELILFLRVVYRLTFVFLRQKRSEITASWFHHQKPMVIHSTELWGFERGRVRSARPVVFLLVIIWDILLARAALISFESNSEEIRTEKTGRRMIERRGGAINLSFELDRTRIFFLSFWQNHSSTFL